MGTVSDNQLVINSINVAAAQYKQSLVGRVFLYVFEGNMIEVAYHETEFRHLTGVATNLTADRLERCQYCDRDVSFCLYRIEFHSMSRQRYRLGNRPAKK